MRCFICDGVLSSEEIKYNHDHDDYDPCSECQEVIDNVFEPLSEEEIDRQIAFEFYYEEMADHAEEDVPEENA